MARTMADQDDLRAAIAKLPRYTSPDGEETWVEWAALRDLLDIPATGIGERAWGIVEAAARMGSCSQTHHDHLAADARQIVAALEREGQIRT